jgi:hypothetical protein
VLSSSWRLDPVGKLAAKYWGVPFIDTLPDMPKKTRRDEILSWLASHPKAKRYAIIDDEDDGLDKLPLFQPSSKTGLTAEIVTGVEKYRQGKRDQTMRASLLVRAGQNIHSLFKRDKS